MPNGMKTWPTRLSVLGFIGGHGARQFPHLKTIYPSASYAIGVDSPNELTKLGYAGLKPNVQLFPLGIGQTAQSLCEGLPQKVTDYIKSIGGMSGSEGMGQCILIGRQGGKRLVASAEFRRFLTQTFIPELRKQSGGAIEEVRFVIVGSLAGATYSGAEEPVADALASATRDSTSAVTVTEFLATGSLPYDGLGDRVWPNGGAALASLAAYVIDPHRDARDIRKLRLIEFPVCGEDDALRDAYLAQLEQASHSSYVAYDQQRSAPNRALNGKYGNIQTWDAAFGDALDFRKDIVPAISHAYVPPLVAVLNREPSSAIAERLELQHSRIPLANASVDEILARVGDDSVHSLIGELERPSFQHTVSVLSHAAGNVRLDLSELESRWSGPARTLNEIDERMQLQKHAT